MAAAVAAAATVGVLAVWLIIYLRISAPINRTFTAAAKSGHVPVGAHSLQRRWDRVITPRAVMQAAAVVALCTAPAMP